MNKNLYLVNFILKVKTQALQLLNVTLAINKIYCMCALLLLFGCSVKTESTTVAMSEIIIPLELTNEWHKQTHNSLKTKCTCYDRFKYIFLDQVIKKQIREKFLKNAFANNKINIVETDSIIMSESYNSGTRFYDGSILIPNKLSLHLPYLGDSLYISKMSVSTDPDDTAWYGNPSDTIICKTLGYTCKSLAAGSIVSIFQVKNKTLFFKKTNSIYYRSEDF